MTRSNTSTSVMSSGQISFRPLAPKGRPANGSGPARELANNPTCGEVYLPSTWTCWIPRQLAPFAKQSRMQCVAER